ncbi:MAG: VOC family protein [Candidatus Geothermarchaeales archaeon]
MNALQHTIVHFELPADNPESLKKFYEEAFGWEIQKVEGPIEYWLIATGPPGESVGGGMYRKDSPEQKPLNYVGVESVDEYSKKIQGLGGKIIRKEEVPGEGRSAFVLDPEGNFFALWESTKE